MLKLRKETTKRKFKRNPGRYEDVRSHELTALGRTIVSLGVVSLVSLGAYLVVSDENIDIFGDSPSGKRSEEKLRELAEQKYLESFSTLNAATKFTVQFGVVSEVKINEYEDNGNGINGLGNHNATLSFNNACLNATAYDIDGGRINGNINGLFVHGKIEGDSPTAAAYAEISRDNQDVLIVHSGNVNSDDLVFSGLNNGGSLEPDNDTTVRILETYGCNVGVTGILPSGASAPRQ